MLLALLCVGWLLFFIHHITQAIWVNYIVDRIAGETEGMIDELMPHRAAGPIGPPPRAGARSATDAGCGAGVRLHPLRRYAPDAQPGEGGAALRAVLRRIGHFVPAGMPLFAVSRADRLSAEVHAGLLACFDIGPVRTLQQDAEFGILQIVDIALKAISPAVNDPSTAINCLDQLGRIMIRWIARDPPDAALYDPPHVLRVSVPWIDLEACSIPASNRSATTRKVICR